MKQKRACFGGLAALPADASENGPLMTRALIGPIALLEAVTCFLSFV